MTSARVRSAGSYNRTSDTAARNQTASSPCRGASSSRPPVCRPHRLSDEHVREPAQEHLRRQIAPMLATEGTLGGNWLGGHRLNGSRDILPAALAPEHDALG